MLDYEKFQTMSKEEYFKNIMSELGFCLGAISIKR